MLALTRIIDYPMNNKMFYNITGVKLKKPRGHPNGKRLRRLSPV
jgi:hypothetical protein